MQDKIERLIDKHMRSLGAAKVSLSSLSSEELWAKSGRLEKGRSTELLRLQDRKGAKYLLSPTHEEEITTVVANAVQSYKDLPLRLYQVSRKYRDELRPRQGLLRGREFVMKDLYTFDTTTDAARATYDQVRKAYSAFFDHLRLPYLTAAADSGNMGGSLSHEYHLASSDGEDTIIICNQCEYAANEEVFPGRLLSTDDMPPVKTLESDACPSCKTGQLKLHRAIEIGHTFYLGTRYSEPLSAQVLDANNKQISIEMGCHGIGISRLIGAIASLLADAKGLNWPLAVSPFEVLIVPGADTREDDTAQVYEGVLGSMGDAVIDDRERPLGWKLKDADLIGYPVIIVLGRRWKEERVVELQCRRWGVREHVGFAEIDERLRSLRSRFDQ